MFGPLGVPELIFILVLALLIFGPKKLPEIGRTLGRGLAEFRRASTELKRTLNTDLSLDDDEHRPPAPATPRRPALTETAAAPAAKAAGATAAAEPPAAEPPAETPPAEPEAGEPAGSVARSAAPAAGSAADAD